jgi:hypothetical protein
MRKDLSTSSVVEENCLARKMSGFHLVELDVFLAASNDGIGHAAAELYTFCLEVS